MSSAKRRYWEYLIILHMSLINMLKSKGPKTEPCGTPEGKTKGNERILEIRTWDFLLVK
jgi:hypothetical protein